MRLLLVKRSADDAFCGVNTSTRKQGCLCSAFVDDGSLEDTYGESITTKTSLISKFGDKTVGDVVQTHRNGSSLDTEEKQRPLLETQETFSKSIRSKSISGRLSKASF